MNKSNSTLKVLLVEDDTIFAIKLTLQLEELGYIVIHCSNGLEAFSMLEQHQADVIVSDISMPTIDGFAFLQLVRKSKEHSNLIFIIVSSYVEPEFVRKGMLLGADDYLGKPFEGADLDNAIKVRINRIESVKSKAVSQTTTVLSKASVNVPVSLSKREGEIFGLLGNGMSNKEIGELLQVSPKTVMNHRQRIMDKLGITGNGSLYEYAKKLKQNK